MVKVLIIVLVLVIGLGSLIVLKKSPQPRTSPVTNQQASSSHYLEYSPTVLTETSNQRRVLFFYASWCPTCRPADTSFKANESQIPEDVRVIRVNYNDPETDADEKALAQKYQITYQHTFVQIDSQDNPVTRWNGGAIDELLNNLKP